MTASPADLQQPHFTLRRCFWLCLPALVIGAIIRLSYLVAVPEVFYGTDSNSYFVTTHSVYLDHHFDLPPKRRYVYPVLLLGAPPIPFCNTAQIVAVAQHLAGLCIIFGIGWVTGHLVRRPMIWVPLITLFPACWPRMIYYEHEMICETLLICAFVATVAVAVPRNGLASDRRLIWFCVLALLIVAVKPAGRPIWLGLMIGAAFITRRPFHWPKVCYATFPLVVLIHFTTGGDGQGPWLFLSSTLPLVRTEGAPYATERALLRPAIESAHHDLPNYAFHQGPYKKMIHNNREESPMGADYANFVADRQRFTTVAQTFAREAVLEHPFQYLSMVGRKIVIAVGNPLVQTRLDPAVFWKEQAESSEGRWKLQADEMRLIYEMDEAAYNTMVAERSKRTVWYTPYIRSFSKLRWLDAKPGPPGESPIIRILPMGWLVLLGFFAALLPYRFARTTLLWLPLLLYLFIVFSIGDTVTRYLHPVEWTAFVLIAVGLDSILDGLALLYRRVRPAPASEVSTGETAPVAG